MVSPPDAYDWSNSNPQAATSLNSSYSETVRISAPEMSTLFTSDEDSPKVLGPAPVTALRQTMCNIIVLDIENLDEIAKGHIAHQLITDFGQSWYKFCVYLDSLVDLDKFELGKLLCDLIMVHMVLHLQNNFHWKITTLEMQSENIEYLQSTIYSFMLRPGIGFHLPLYPSKPHIWELHLIIIPVTPINFHCFIVMQQITQSFFEYCSIIFASNKWSVDPNNPSSLQAPMTEEPTSQVVPVMPDTRATTTPARTTSTAPTYSTSFEGALEQLANHHLLADWGDEDTDERELAIKEYLPKGDMTPVAYYPNPVEVHFFKRQLGNALAQVPSIVYKFDDGYSFLIDSLLAVYQVHHMDTKQHLPEKLPEPDNLTVTIGVNLKTYKLQNKRCLEWEQYDVAAVQLINRKFPNMLSGLVRNPIPDALPVGITAKAVYDHIKGQINTTKVLQESYLDLLMKIQARKYVPNPALGPTQYFVDTARDQFQANLLKDGHTKHLLMVMEELWFTHHESTIDQDRAMGKAKVPPKYKKLFKTYRLQQLLEAYVKDEAIQSMAKANLVTDAITAWLSVLENRHDTGMSQIMEYQDNIAYNAVAYKATHAPPTYYDSLALPTYTPTVYYTPNTAASTFTMLKKANQSRRKPRLKNWRQCKFYCYLCGVNISHASLKCTARGKQPDHKAEATLDNHMGGSDTQTYMWMKWSNPDPTDNQAHPRPAHPTPDGVGGCASAPPCKTPQKQVSFALHMTSAISLGHGALYSAATDHLSDYHTKVAHTAIPPRAYRWGGHKFTEGDLPLVSVVKLCVHGCKVTFTNNIVKVHGPAKNTILEGVGDPLMNLYMVPLHSESTLLAPPCAPPRVPPIIPTLCAPTRAPPPIHLMTPRPAKYPRIQAVPKLINFYHAVAGYPTKATWISAIDRESFATRPGLTAQQAYRARATDRLVSTIQKKPDQKKIHDVCFDVVSTEEIQLAADVTISTDTKPKELVAWDLPKRYPIISHRGHKYVFLMYNYNSNYIDVEPMIKSHKSKDILCWFTACYVRMKENNMGTKLAQMDNETSKKLIAYITKNNLDYQLASLGDHRLNHAKCAIQTYKNHFIACLYGVDGAYPLYAYELRNGAYNYNKHPLAPLGCRVIIHDRPRRGGRGRTMGQAVSTLARR
eukprot:jgi/Psemu1/8153/gm1.8153_g